MTKRSRPFSALGKRARDCAGRVECDPADIWSILSCFGDGEKHQAVRSEAFEFDHACAMILNLGERDADPGFKGEVDNALTCEMLDDAVSGTAAP